MIAELIIKKAAKDGFEAINQHDLPKVMSSYQDDATLIYPGEVPGSGTFKGKAAIEGWWRQWFDQFPSTHFDIKDIYVKSINAAVIHFDAQVTNRDGRAGKNSGVGVYEIKGSKIFREQLFIFDQGEDKRMWETV
jgi:ketosteroid isomerase-like protein